MGQVIAIDGPAGAGKSTIARNLAEQLGFTYIDTGAMYRSVTLAALRNRVALEDEARLEQLARAAIIEFAPVRRVLLNGEDVTDAIRGVEVTSGASRVAALGRVRSALVAKQKRMAETSDIVMEGRDIGSVVFPDARIKIYLDADPAERARRRSGDMPDVPIEQLTAQMRERDERDRRRTESPLIQAPDAVYLDSTGLTPDEVARQILALARDRIILEGIRTANAEG
jgi:cytidylate kinase